MILFMLSRAFLKMHRDFVLLFLLVYKPSSMQASYVCVVNCSFPKKTKKKKTPNKNPITMPSNNKLNMSERNNHNKTGSKNTRCKCSLALCCLVRAI